MMPIATLRFSLPDEEHELRACQQGQAAATALAKIDQYCRSIVKHGQPTPEEIRLAEEIRNMIPYELLEG